MADAPVEAISAASSAPPAGGSLDAPPAPRWRVRPFAPPAVVERLMRELRIPPLLASVLWARGLGDAPLDALQPRLAPTRIPDLDAAAERFERALERGERILIHGDYDADGISGTALLTLGLRALGGDVTPFIPNRLTDGYGIHPARVAEHAERADLLLTVDCGISNLEEIAALQRAGVEVIVSDHHSPGATLPDCLIVHPRMNPDARPGAAELTGAGVAFHLLWALHRRLGLEAPLEYTDLATLGTVADVAPLLGENRALILEGLARLRDSRWPGLRAAVRQSSIRGAPTARDVAFVLAPRLNAAGRLGEAELGLELLITASERRARELAAYLDARNADRRRIQDDMFEQAAVRVDPAAPAIVVGDPEWHPGVMGIVASKLLERHFKPVFIHARGKGSVRSTPGISAVGALRAAAPHLERFGGHAEAAGFAIRGERIDAFRDAVYDFVASHPEPLPSVTADALLAGHEIGEGLYRAVCDLEPYGQGHPAPLFAVSEPLEHARAVGRNGATLQLRLAGVKGVAWRQGALADRLRPGAPLNVALALNENEWQGRRSVEFRAEALRPAAALAFAEPTPAPDLDADPGADPGTDPGAASVEPEAVRRFRRGRPDAPPEGTAPAEPIGDLAALRAALERCAGEAAPRLWLTTLPLADDPLAATEPLRRALQALPAAARLHFDLDARALAELEGWLLRYPDLHDLRRGFVCLQRGRPLPFEAARNALVERTLNDLDLLDPLGRVRRGVKRDPFDAAPFRQGLLERYRLQGFVNAYRALDDRAFARAVATLLASSP